MNTPICDFVKEYSKSGVLRLHMPGHKGATHLGPESLDITEVEGADVLYAADGIIRQSEENAAILFGSKKTLYSVEGSSLCIRAMLYLALLHGKKEGRPPRIAAGRNAHKTFLSASALLDFEIDWLYGEGEPNLLSCTITPQQLDRYFTDTAEKPAAVYLTTPDYLGNLLDLSPLYAVCKKHDTLLLVDHAHGAYLKFLPKSLHPMDVGADMCCDSAHKTLPVLTGGAYLHLSHTLPEWILRYAEEALALFASTSPSYLILQSLDQANRYLSEEYPALLQSYLEEMERYKGGLQEHGFSFVGREPLKWTIDAKAYGYTGTDMAAFLRKNGIVCEYADPDYMVLMLTPDLSRTDLSKLQKVLLEIPKKKPITEPIPTIPHPERAVLSPREAMFSPKEEVPVEKAVGRIFASPCVSCPPAIPIAVCGERLTEEAIAVFRYYGIRSCFVVMELWEKTF